MIRVEGLAQSYGDFTAKVKAIESLECLEDDSAYQHYALAFKNPEEAMAFAPCVATALLNEGCWLYGLKSEQRSLESVFIEASMQ